MLARFLPEEFRGIGKQSNSGPQIISAERPDRGVITV